MLKQLQKATGILLVLCALFGSLDAFAQNRAISGKVLDNGGQPIIGAAVMVPGTSTGATTDLNGSFSLGVATGTTLEVSCIGYATRTVTAADNMVITLEEDAEILEETVVIGYGVQKKSDVTGAIASVKESDLENRTSTDIAQAIQGGRRPDRPLVRCSGRCLLPPDPRLLFELHDLSAHDRRRP